MLYLMHFSSTSTQLKCIKYNISCVSCSNLADFKYTSLV